MTVVAACTVGLLSGDVTSGWGFVRGGMFWEIELACKFNNLCQDRCYCTDQQGPTPLGFLHAWLSRNALFHYNCMALVH